MQKEVDAVKRCRQAVEMTWVRKSNREGTTTGALWNIKHQKKRRAE